MVNGRGGEASGSGRKQSTASLGKQRSTKATLQLHPENFFLFLAQI
jgi:hypothetical protein